MSAADEKPSEDALRQQSTSSSSTQHRPKGKNLSYEAGEHTPYNSLFDESTRDAGSMARTPYTQRLTPVRLISPTPPLPVHLQREMVDSGQAKTSASETEDSRSEQLYPPRTFSRQCRHVMLEQGVVTACDVMSVYLACSFFSACSLGFVRSLVLAGGPPAWRGVSVPPHATVYKEGDLGHALYVVVRGKAAAFDKNGVAEREFVISNHFGDLQVLGILPRRLETVRAMTYLQLLVLTQKSLNKLLNASSEDDFIEAAADVEGSLPKKRSKVQKQKTISRAKCMFPEERRHFEMESVRLFKETLEQSGAGSGSGSRRSLAVNALVRPVKPEARAGRKVVQAMMGLQPIKDSEECTERSEPPEAESGSRVHISAAPNSVRWMDATDGSEVEEHAEANYVRDRLYGKVMTSLRGDMRRGFMMPADSIDGDKRKEANFAKPRERGAKKDAEASGAEGDEDILDVQVQDPQDPEECDQEVYIHDVAAPLDPHCLPPLALLSPVQKHGILRQLRHQNRARGHTDEPSPKNARKTMVESAMPRKSMSPRHTLAASRKSQSPRQALASPRQTLASPRQTLPRQTLVSPRQTRFQALVGDSDRQAPPGGMKDSTSLASMPSMASITTEASLQLASSAHSSITAQ